MFLFKRQIVGEFETGEFGQPLHEAIHQALGKDYERTHWNDKAKGVEYEYTNRDGSATFRVFITAEVEPVAEPVEEPRKPRGK